MSLDPMHQELLDLILDVSFERRKVTLASGRESDFYLDLRQTLMRPKGVDLAGRLIRTLHQGSEDAGRHEKTWLGRDQQGRTVAAGVYFYRLQAGDEVETRRMLLAK